MAATAGTLDGVEEPVELADAFLLDAAVLRHVQADPQLPAELLPDDWPGVGLRNQYTDFHRVFRHAWRRYQRAGGA